MYQAKFSPARMNEKANQDGQDSSTFHERFVTRYTKIASSVTIWLSFREFKQRRNHPIKREDQHLGLSPSPAYREGSKVLYGENTFYVDLQPMWQYTRTKHIRDLLPARLNSQHPHACLACSDRVHAVNHDRTVRGQQYANMLQTSDSWNPVVHKIRRLQISLRPYSYSQFADVCLIKFWLQRIPALEDRRLVYSCFHSFQNALPPLRQLDLLILHVAKLPLALAEEEMELSSAVLYPVNATPWRLNVQLDMARERPHGYCHLRNSRRYRLSCRKAAAQWD